MDKRELVKKLQELAGQCEFGDPTERATSMMLLIIAYKLQTEIAVQASASGQVSNWPDWI